jgi:soluble lytic murein transglycosylase-like protein
MAEETTENWYKDPNPYDMVQAYVQTAAEEYGVRESLINAVINAESSFKPKARSRKGAMGYMQITPKVAEKYGVRDPYDPVQNIRAGTQYLRDLIKRYDGDEETAIKAFHMGPTAVDEERAAGPKTRAHVKKVMQGAASPSTVQEAYKRPREDWKRRSIRELQQIVK